MKRIVTYGLLLPVFILIVGHAVHAATADDVVCIRCVDTTDINYDAVTSNRILDGTIRNADLGLDAVTSSRIKAGEVRTSDLAPNAVTTSRIMNGAVTEAKLAQELLDMIELLQAKVAALEAENAAQREFLEYFSKELLYDPSTGNYYPTIRVTGANLQLVNGLNDTQSANGTGNLIVGYNLLPGEFHCSTGLYDDQTSCSAYGFIWSDQHRSGSHNVVIGEANNYTQHGGLVAGAFNTINRQFSTVPGGYYNTASGYASSVTGGLANTASGYVSSVTGGQNNTASNTGSVVSGGFNGTASGVYGSVSGGYFNNATSQYSGVSGGRNNTASEWYSSVTGGRGNTASGESSSVSGGFERSATSFYDWVAGALFENF